MMGINLILKKSRCAFREKEPSDDLSWKNPGEAGQYVFEMNVMIVADSGFLIHYNESFTKSRYTGLWLYVVGSSTLI